MRELNEQEMNQVTGGSRALSDVSSLQLTGPQANAAMAAARAHLATIQGELDALNVNEQIWSSVTGS